MVQPGGVNPEHEGIRRFEYIDGDTPDEIRKAVRKNIYNGATVIKRVTILGLLQFGLDGISFNFCNSIWPQFWHQVLNLAYE